MNVIFAARDPGGANVVSEALPGKDHTDKVGIWAFSESAPSFRRQGWEPAIFEEGVSIHQMKDAWSKFGGAEKVVTGTSHYAPFESHLWSICREAGGSSLALLDSWCNIDKRFRLDQPDFVGAIDEVQRDRMLADGWDDNAVIVIGHTWVTRIAGQIDPLRQPKIRKRVRNILFVSEPIASDVACGSNPPYGFDEQDSFDLLLDAVSELDYEVDITVKRHPYESSELWDLHHAARCAGLKGTLKYFPQGEELNDLILKSDMVVGISSMLLIECLAMGIPVVSVQPNLEREDTCILSDRKAIPLISSSTVMTGMIDSSIEERQNLLDQGLTFFDGFKNCPRAIVEDWLAS